MPRHKSRKRARRSRRKRGGGCGDITIEDKMREGGVFKAANEFAKQYNAPPVTDLKSFIEVGRYFTSGKEPDGTSRDPDGFYKRQLDTFQELTNKPHSQCGDCPSIPAPWNQFLATSVMCNAKTHNDKIAGDGCCSYEMRSAYGGRRRRRKSRRKSKKRRKKTKKRRRRRRR